MHNQSQSTTLPPQQISIDVLIEKYAKNGETSQEDIFKRVAKGIASVEKTPELREEWENKFYENMMNGAVGAGRIMSAAGTGIAATLLNCFVQSVGDCIDGYDENGLPGIYEALRQSACTMQKGGGVGYNFSNIRPKGSWVKSVKSTASGPCSYMDIFDASCKTIESAGNRRGAQLGALNINHPDVLEFVLAKRTKGRWNNFNVSVLVTDEFMKAKEEDKEIELVHKAQPSQKQIDEGAYQRDDGLYVYKKIKARDLWDSIMKSNYDYAEPGILFYDNINNDNNLRAIENIVTTNPCGEQPLPSYGCCDLGPIILTRFVKNPFSSEAYFDTEGFEKAVRTQVRFLDNVLDASVWPLTEQYEESQNKRRIGVGFTGLANALAMLNFVYYEQDGLHMAEIIASGMRDTAYDESVELAKEKGKFPLFDADKYLEEGTFASRLPIKIKEKIREFGIRNSHLLSIAPTGTVSLAFADNASNGIEPPFSLAYTRKKRIGNDGEHQMYNVLDHAFRVWLSTLENQSFAKAIEDAVANYYSSFHYEGKEYKVSEELPKNLVTALNMTVDQHLSMMTVVQPYICTSISKTVNCPEDYPFEDFKNIYDTAWKSKLKGVSTYRPNSILGSVLSVEKPKEEPKKETPVLTGVVTYPGATKSYEEHVKEMMHESFPSRKDGMLQGITTKGRFFTQQGEQKFIVTINFVTIERNTEQGLIQIQRPVEFLLTSNFTTNSSAWDASMRFMSLAARSGVPIPKLIENMKEITWEHGGVRYGTMEKEGRQIPRWHDSDVAAIGFAIKEALIQCGYLDSEGNVKLPKQSDSLITEKHVHVGHDNHDHSTVDPVMTDVSEKNDGVIAGSKCVECGAHAVIKTQGCSKCTFCGWLGECG